MIRTFHDNHAEQCRINENDSSPVLSKNIYLHHAILAANCCIALAKAHSVSQLSPEEACSGNVPISRQCAIMLMEMPHFITLKTDDGSEPGYMFKVSSMTLKEAENLGRVIVALSQGDIAVSLLLYLYKE